MMRSSATPIACTPPLSKSSDLQIVDTLDGRAEQVVADVTDAPAWPILRANLIALAAETGEQHPLVHLYEAALGRDLSAGLVRHGLRHTALTWMADAGIDLHILQRSQAIRIRRSRLATCIPMCGPCWTLGQRFRPGGP